MTIYDIVKVVSSASASDPPGRWLEDFRSTLGGAEERAEAWNQLAGPGIRYAIESHDEESRERAMNIHDMRRAQNGNARGHSPAFLAHNLARPEAP